LIVWPSSEPDRHHAFAPQPFNALGGIGWKAQPSLGIPFRIYRTQRQFVRYMQARRAPFGRTLSRSVVGAANIHQFAGLPEGNYESIIFKTAFEHKSSTVERVILVKHEVGWRVIDYRIY
jgi:hypothetical protein